MGEAALRVVHCVSRPDLVGASVQADPSEVLLREVYAYPGGSGLTVRGGMVASVDGAAVGPDGLSGSLGTAADRRVFMVLRSLADAVVVGAGTARLEGYGPAALSEPLRVARLAAEQDEVPHMVVVSASGDLPDALVGDDRTHVCESLPGVWDLCENRGWVHLLCEGGPSLLAQVASQGRLAELCVTTSGAVVAGTGLRITSGDQADLSMSLASVMVDEATVLTRWVHT